MVEQWDEPEPDWVPLGQAIFRFGVADDRDSNVLSEKPYCQLTETEIVEGTSFSLTQLTRILKQKTDAADVKVDRDKGTFVFLFHRPGSATCIGGPPWAILRQRPDAALSADRWLDAEALFNKEGFVRVRDEDAARDSKLHNAVHKATSLVWHQFMLRVFDFAVSTKRVMLYARIQKAWTPLQQLPADVWPILDILDWQNGIGRDPQGVLYYSIHAARAYPESALAARFPAGPAADATQAPSTVKAATECKHWLSSLGKENPA